MSQADGRIRVMQVTHDLGIGGLPRVIETLCMHLDPDRFELEVFCLHEGGPLADRLAEAGIESFVMDRPPTRMKADYFTLPRMMKHMRERRPTIVHTHNTEPFIEAGLAAKLAGVPVLIHTDHARDFPDKWRYMFLERLMSLGTHTVVAVSDHGKDNLRKYVKVAERKLATILNGVDAAEVIQERDPAGWRPKLGIPQDAPLVGLGARFSRQKGIEYLIRGMPAVLERCPDTHVIIAGYGELEDELKSEAAQHEVTERVHFIGRVNSMADVLSAIDIFALPSMWEGLPMAILEAMAAQVPIVATDVGGVGSALEDGRSAVLVPSADPAAFADGLCRMIESGDGAKAMAAEARKDFDEQFSAQAMARAYAELYEAAIS